VNVLSESRTISFPAGSFVPHECCHTVTSSLAQHIFHLLMITLMNHHCVISG